MKKSVECLLTANDYNYLKALGKAIELESDIQLANKNLVGLIAPTTIIFILLIIFSVVLSGKLRGKARSLLKSWLVVMALVAFIGYKLVAYTNTTYDKLDQQNQQLSQLTHPSKEVFDLCWLDVDAQLELDLSIDQSRVIQGR